MGGRLWGAPARYRYRVPAFEVAFDEVLAVVSARATLAELYAYRGHDIAMTRYNANNRVEWALSPPVATRGAFYAGLGGAL